MGLTNAYVLPITRIPDLFRRIQDGQAPERFTQQLLKDWGFSSTNDRAFIPLLKALGFLTTDGAFDADCGVNWTCDDGWTISGGVAVADCDEFKYVRQPISVVNGKTYKLSYDIISYTSGVLIASSATFGTTANLITTVGHHEKIIYCSSAGGNLLIGGASGTGWAGTIDNISLTEHKLPHQQSGYKFLECTSAGTIAIPCKQAYGEWEFDWYKGHDVNEAIIHFISDKNSIEANSGYYYFMQVAERTGMGRRDAGVQTSLSYSAASYIVSNTWYRAKITRTLDGKSYHYIKGGAFGSDDWTLVDVSGGLGTNPVTDNTNTISEHLVLDLDVGDRIGNIKVVNLVEQGADLLSGLLMLMLLAHKRNREKLKFINYGKL